MENRTDKTTPANKHTNLKNKDIMKPTKLMILLLVIFFTSAYSAKGQKQKDMCDSIPVFFDEIKVATEKKITLWNKNLYSPILLVDKRTRQVYANEPDTVGILTPCRSIYSGVLPDEINIANTAISWGGKNWAMVMLPLPQDKHARIDLLAHELFHVAQRSMELVVGHNPGNDHLDQKDGRIYIRLELEALKKALQLSSDNEKVQQLKNALIFRKYRNLLFPDSPDFVTLFL